MAVRPEDIELKFDGEPVKRLDGAPIDALIMSLSALQRMVSIIGMSLEGRILSERLKPTTKVKQEYAIICRGPVKGSYIQPFAVMSQRGVFTPAASVAREKLLDALRAFDSGNDEIVEKVLPNPRERWFMAKAALGLLPPEESGLQITLRVGSRGPFNFKAERARALLAKFKNADPPEIGEWKVAGKLKAIDFGQTILTIKPANDPAIRMDYPLSLEAWLTANVRKRLNFIGRPTINQKGNVSSFKEIYSVTELEPSLEPILEFKAGSQTIRTNRQLSIPVTVDWTDKVFVFQDKALGIDAFSLNYADLRQSILDELDILWRHYAMARDNDLDAEAKSVKAALLARFRAVDQ